MRISASRLTAQAALILTMTVGCGPQAAPRPTTVAVKGRVTYKGKPLAKGTVRFRPVDAGRTATGALQPDGSFVLSTYKEGDGATIGVHQVSIRDTGAKTSTEVIPRKYGQPLTSKLEAEVTPEKTDFTFNLD